MNKVPRGDVIIHPTALVHEKAVLGDGTRVGAYSIVDENVVLGRGCNIQEHVVLRGHTQLGDGVIVYPFALIGGEPQHTKYRGEPTRVEIGDRTTIRESVTVHRGTPFGNGVTIIGSDTYLMAYVHVAHDCFVGKHVYIANGTQLAGHAQVHDHAVVSGMSAIPQFLRVGSYAYIGGHSALRKDVPPFVSGKGSPFRAQGINAVGLERQGFSPESIQRLRKVFRIFFLRKGTVSQAIEQVTMEVGDSDEVRLFLEFVRGSKQGTVR